MTTDANGNLLSSKRYTAFSANDLALVYDAENRLVSVTGDLSVTLTPTPTATSSTTATSTLTRTATLPPTATSTSVYTPTPTATPTNTPTESATPTLTSTSQPGTTLTFAPLDDATIQSAAPDTNAGSATSVIVDNSPKQNFLIKFQVSGLTGRSVTRATLKLYNVSSSDVGGNFYRVNDQTWEEETVTWNNAPAHDNTLVGSLGAVTTGNWYSLDLTSLIAADGTYSLRVSSTSSDGADYRSKEGANPPVLEVEVAGGATATTGATATASETPTPTHTPTPTLPPTATATLPAGNVLTFALQDDASIHSGSPGSNYGANPTLYVDNSPVQHILLKFQVSGLAGRTVTRATLKLYNTDNSSIGGKFYRVNDQSWTEETVTWNNAPAHDNTLVASLGAVTAGNWYSVDLTSLISADGTYSLRVSSTSSDGADYSSKEGANPPVLEVEVAGGSTATPGPTATPTPTFTQTASPTFTPTATATATPQTYQMTYSYDGDGRMVKSVLGDVVTHYVGTHYEKTVQGSQQNERKYYFAGSNRLALRENGTLAWLLSDHLGSTSVTANASGNMLSSLRYSAFGEVRAASGTTNTDYLYTGQRSEAEIGLYFYNTRWYDDTLGRFTQPDIIVPQPGNPMDWDRHQYVRSNPINYSDPSGNKPCDGENSGGDICDQVTKNDLNQLLRFQYSWTITNINNWTIRSVEKLIKVGQDLSSMLGNDTKVSNIFGTVGFSQATMKYAGLGEAHKVTLSSGFSAWTVVHELGHSVDGSSGWTHSRELASSTGGYTNKLVGLLKQITGQCSNNTLPGCNNAGYFYGGIPLKGSDAQFNRKEDFAESFAGYFYPEVAVDYINIHFPGKQYPNLNYSYPIDQSPRYLWMGGLVNYLAR